MMEIRRGALAELREYHGWLREQFHEGEIKPLELVETLYARGRYAAYGLYEDDELRAYMLLARGADPHVWLLDYFAVLPAYQDHGLGGLSLKLLSEICAGDTLLLETEEPDTAEDDAEREVCLRRLAFYQEHCGCRDTGVRVRLFGFDYRIMLVCGFMESMPVMRDKLDAIYRDIIPPEYLKDNLEYPDTFSEVKENGHGADA